MRPNPQPQPSPAQDASLSPGNQPQITTLPPVSIIVPFRPSSPERIRSWAWVKRWWTHHLPGAEILTADHPGPPDVWNKSASVNQAAERAVGRVLVIADSDVFLADIGVLAPAVEAAIDAPWVMPHKTVLRLKSTPTDEVLARGVDSPTPRRDLARAAYSGFPGGGIVILSRESFNAVGGMDPAFTGWGLQDAAFAMALNTIVGSRVQFRSDLWHLWHDPGPRINSPEYRVNRRRMELYRRFSRPSEFGRRPERFRDLLGLD